MPVYYIAAALEAPNILMDEELRDAIQKARAKNPVVEGYLKLPPDGFVVKRGILLQDGLVYVLGDTELKLILKRYYNRKTVKHLKQEKTLELVTREYTWSGICSFVEWYIQTCDTYTRNETLQD